MQARPLMSYVKPLLTAILHRPVDNYGVPSTSRSGNDGLHLPKSLQNRLEDIDRLEIHVPDISRISTRKTLILLQTQSLRNSTGPENSQGKSKAVGGKWQEFKGEATGPEQFISIFAIDIKVTFRGRDRGNRQGGARVGALGNTNK